MINTAYKKLISNSANNNDTNSFSKLVVKFFNGERNLDLMPFAYNDFILNGKYHSPSKFWNDLTKSNEYYIYRNECELFDKISDKLMPIANDIDVIVDLGPGSGEVVKNKTFKIMNLTKSLKTYIPIDVSKAFLNDVVRTTKKEFKGFEITPIQGDIYSHQFGCHSQKPLYIFAGAALVNTPIKNNNPNKNQVINRLKKLRSGISSNGMLLIGYDANQDGSSAIKAYNHPANNNFIMSFMYQIAANLNCIDYDPSGFHCKAEWDDHLKSVQIYAQATKDQQFSVSGNHFKVQEGDKFHIASSSRFTTEQFEDMAMKAGFKPITYIQDNNQHMTLHLLEAI